MWAYFQKTELAPDWHRFAGKEVLMEQIPSARFPQVMNSFPRAGAAADSLVSVHNTYWFQTSAIHFL